MKRSVKLAKDIFIGKSVIPPVIAEAGVLAFGEVSRGKRFVDEAVKAGVKLLKFQAFIADHVVGEADVFWKNRLRERELSKEKFFEIRQYAEERGIVCFATTHNEDDLRDFAKEGMAIIKIGSGDSNNTHMIDIALKTGKPVIVSLGLLFEKEAEAIFRRYKKYGNQLIFLHCVTLYPAPPHMVRLSLLETWRKRFPHFWFGYSDHTIGTAVPLAAVAKGAALIEKHICLPEDRVSPKFESFDIPVALTPVEMKQFIEDVAVVAKASANGKEDRRLKQNEVWARKSVVIRHPLKKGSIVRREDVVSKRPCDPKKGHISIARLDKVVGKMLRVDIPAGTFLTEKHLGL